MTEAIKPYHEAAEFIKERIGAQTPQLGIVLGSGLGGIADEMEIVQTLDYSQIEGLRIEAKEKLEKFRPLSIGQASRISGVSPADIAVLLIYLK